MGFFAGPAPQSEQEPDMGVKERLARRYQVVTVDLGDGTQMTGTRAEINAYLAQHEPRRMAQQNTNKQTPKPNVLPPARHPQPATGATTRLPRHCRHCSDELPPDARFCIACGRPV